VLSCTYYQRIQHRKRAHCAVAHECRGFFQQAANAWHAVAQQVPEQRWQEWAIRRAQRCLLKIEGKMQK